MVMVWFNIQMNITLRPFPFEKSLDNSFILWEICVTVYGQDTSSLTYKIEIQQYATYNRNGPKCQGCLTFCTLDVLLTYTITVWFNLEYSKEYNFLSKNHVTILLFFDKLVLLYRVKSTSSLSHKNRMKFSTTPLTTRTVQSDKVACHFGLGRALDCTYCVFFVFIFIYVSCVQWITKQIFDWRIIILNVLHILLLSTGLL